MVPRDGADTERIMNHSSVLRKYKVRTQRSDVSFDTHAGRLSHVCALLSSSGQHRRGAGRDEPPHVHRQLH